MKACYSIMVFFLCLFGSLQKADAGDVALVLKEHMESGMFASFATVLGALHLYETGQIQGFHINMKTGPYVDPDRGDNWWEYYYLPIHLGNPDISMHDCTAVDVHNLA